METAAADTPQIYVSRALERIVSASSRRHVALREACTQSLELLKHTALVVPYTGGEPDPTKDGDPDAAVASVLKALHLACEAQVPKIAIPALDSYQKLVTFGLVRRPSDVDQLSEAVASCFVLHDSAVHLQMLKVFLAGVTSHEAPMRGAALSRAVRCSRDLHVLSGARSGSTNADTARASLKQMINHVLSALEAELVARRERECMSPRSPGASPLAPVVDDCDGLTTDSLNIVKDLCSLCVTPKDAPSAQPADEVSQRGSILALELLADIVGRAGSTLRAEPRFVEALRTSVCDALLQTSLCPLPRVLRLSLAVFSELLRKFKEPLKNELGVLMLRIYLPILRGRASTNQQRLLVVQALYDICKDHVALADIYANYDLTPPPPTTPAPAATPDVAVQQQQPEKPKDQREEGVFEAIASALSLTAQTSGDALFRAHGALGSSGAQEMALCALSLESLVMVMRSLKILLDSAKEHTIAAMRIPSIAGSGTPDAQRRAASEKRQQATEYPDPYQMREALLSQSKREITDKTERQVRFVNVEPSELVRPMFDVTWGTAIVVLSVLFERFDELKIVDLCIAGLKYGIHISAVLNMETERFAFVTALKQLTVQEKDKEAKYQMRQKNLTALSTLVGVIYSDGNFLQESWSVIFNCASFLDMQAAMAAKVPQEAPKDQVAQDASLISLESIYKESTNLSDSAIIDFIKGLARVSLSEINQSDPRTYCLQRLVLTACLNMRTRPVWPEIWEIIKRHVMFCGCHENAELACKTMDLLRDLSERFLETEEPPNSQAQRDLLKTWALIFLATTHAKVKEQIVRSLKIIVVSRGKNIRSGWKSLLSVATMASQGLHTYTMRVLTVSFEIMSEVCKNHYKQVASSFFPELLSALSTFSKCTHGDVSKKAFEGLLQCARGVIVDGCPALPEVQGEEAAYKFTSEFAHVSLWFPALSRLAVGVTHPNKELRTSAQTALFSMLSENGHLFSPNAWRIVVRGVLLPIFSHVGYMCIGGSVPIAMPDAWLESSCLGVLQSIISLYVKFWDMSSCLIPDLLNLLMGIIMQENTLLSGVGVVCLHQLTMECGHHFTKEMWDEFAHTVTAVCKADCELMSRVATIDASLPYSGQMPRHARAVSVMPTSTASMIPQQTRASEMHNCSTCGATEVDSELLRCQLCTGIYYCSAHCQREDWTRHFKSCSISSFLSDGPHLDEFQVLPSALQQKQRTEIVLPTIGMSLRSLTGRLEIVMQMLSNVSEMAHKHYSCMSDENVREILAAIAAVSTAAQDASAMEAPSSPTARRSPATIELTELKERRAFDSLTLFLQFAFFVFAAPGDNRRLLSQGILIPICERSLKELAENKEMTDNQLKVSLQILDGIASVEDYQYRHLADQFWDIFVELTLHDNAQVRGCLRKHLVRAGSLAGVTHPPSQ